jgi:putative ABC transport system permease protein
MRIQLKKGRLFTSSGNESRVVLINETLARKVWPGQEVIGRELKVNWMNPDSAMVVVGVVADVHNTEITSAVMPTIYYSIEANPTNYLSLVVRTDLDDTGITQAVRRIVGAMDPSVPLIDPRTMDSRVSDALESHRSPAVLLVRDPGAGAGRGGTLRRAVLFRQPPVTGDRRAGGAGRRDGFSGLDDRA